MPTDAPSPLGTIASVWGVAGVVVLLSTAVVRLWPIALEALQAPLTTIQKVFLVGWVIFMAYSEGYRGFQKAFSPRVVSRAAWLRHNPSAVRVLFAPAFCMGFFHATRKRLIVSWVITSMVILFIIVARRLPTPWRGLVDLGVVVGLTWGIIAILAWGLVHLRGRPLPTPPDVPVGT